MSRVSGCLRRRPPLDTEGLQGSNAAGVAAITARPLSSAALQRSKNFRKPRFGYSPHCGGEHRLLMVPRPLEEVPAGISYQDIGAIFIGLRPSSADEPFHFEDFEELKH